MYIITGHSGFVGKNLLSKFRSDKEKIVIIKKKFKKIENTNDKHIKVIN